MSLGDSAEGSRHVARPSQDAPKPVLSPPSQPSRDHRSPFASRLPTLRRAEFFTESLNNTVAGSPSPAPASKVARNNKLRGPARGTAGGLEAALRKVQARRNEKEPVFATPSSLRKPRQRSAKKEPEGSAQRPRTPDASGRKVHRKMYSGRDRISSEDWSKELGTPTSPPGGLLETYRQIEDEEILHSSSEDDEDIDEPGEQFAHETDTDAFLERYDAQMRSERNSRVSRSSPPASPKADDTTHASQGNVRPDLQPMSTQERLELLSFSPPSLKGSSRTPTPTGSPARSPPALDLPPAAREGEETESMASFGRLSDGSSRGRGSPQLERDQQRVQAAIASDVQPFRRARRRGRSGLTVENLRRQDGGSGSGSSLGSGSGSSIVSDQVMNIPPGWGRKARRRSWMDNIAEVQGSEDGKQQGDESLQPVTKDQNKGESISAIAAETPLPPAESGPQEEEAEEDVVPTVPPQSQPQHAFQRARKLNSSGDLLRSLQRSESPQIRAKSAELEAIRERERQSLEKSALTTNRLGELKEKKSLERVGRRSVTSIIANERGVEALANAKPLDKDRPLAKSTAREAIEEVDEDPTPQKPKVPDEKGRGSRDPPVQIFDSDSGRSMKDSGFESSFGSPTRKARPTDAQDVLRRLARAESSSPEGAIQEHAVDGPSEPRAPSAPVLRGGDGKKKENVPPRQASPRRVVKDTPRPTTDISKFKTPVVSGAWIDTPLPGGQTTKRPNSSSQTILEDESVSIKDVLSDIAQNKNAIPLEQTAPKLPKSALAAIIERAKASKATGADDTLQLDESTIASLEDLLVNADHDTSNVPLPPDTKPDPSPKPSKPTQPKRPSNAKPEQLDDAPTDKASSDRLTSRLSHLRSSISEAKIGLGSLQRRLSGPKPPGKPDRDEDDDECDEAGEVHDFIVPCERCARRSRLATSPFDAGGDGLFMDWGWHWQPVEVPLPRLWRWKPARLLPSPTRLGMWLGVVVVLVIAELIVADAYTPPFYAETMYDYGVDIDAPRPPFILPQLFWRYSGVGALAGLAWYWICVLMRLLASVGGFSPGIFGHRDDAYTMEKIKYVFTPGVELVTGPLWDKANDWGFGTDEYL